MTQAPATPELVERLRDQRHVVQGDGLAALLATTSEAADALEAQQARIAELEGELKAALREVGKHAREAGEAIGRLKMSEAAGIVDGWRERAEAAEALADRYEKAQPTDALYGLVNAARRHMATHPVFRTRRIGGEASRARLEQEDQIASEDALRAAVQAALSTSPDNTNPEAEHG